MTTLPKELSPERCLHLREQGILRVLVNLLHEHTFEPQNKSEADFSIELFLMDFNRKAELRARSSQQIRTIVKHTAKNEDELKVLGWLETLRSYIDRLYNFIVGWKTMTEDPSKLSECTNQLIEVAGAVDEVFPMLGSEISGQTIRPIFEQFGGVFVIVDYLRAQTRFNAKCHPLESDLIDSTPLLRFANDSKLVLRYAVAILSSVAAMIDSNNDIRLFLGNSRSLHEIILDIAEDAYNDDDLPFVQVYCHILYCLYYTNDLTVPPSVLPSTSHLKDCGVIKCLAKIGMNTKNPETFYQVLEALLCPLVFDPQNAFEFVSIDGAVDMLIDVLVPSKEKDEDVENAEWYEGQRYVSVSVLYLVSRHFSTQDRRLLTIFESRDLVVILVRYLEQISSSEGVMCVLVLLGTILECSEDQHRKFAEMVNGKEVVKRFESCENEDSARVSKEIGKMFE